MKKYLLLLLIFAFSVISKGQNIRTDSLLVALQRAQTDSERVELNCQLSKHYQLIDVDKAFSHARSAEALAIKAHYLNGQGKALNLIGAAYLFTGEFDKALGQHYQALSVFENTRDTLGIIASYNGLASMYSKIEDRENAYKYFFVAIKFAKKAKDKSGLMKAYNNIGNLYEDVKDYKTALAYFQKAAVLSEALNEKRNLAVNLLNIGDLYQHFEHPEQGLPYLFRAEKIDAQIKNERNRPLLLSTIAEIYRAMGNKTMALKYARQSYKKAVELGSSKKIIPSAALLQLLYAEQKNYVQAYKYQSAFIVHEKLLNKENQKKVAAELTAKYEAGKKELAFQKLQAESDNQALKINQRNVILFVVGAVVILLLGMLFALLKSQTRLKFTASKLKQAYTQMQGQNTEINSQKNELTRQAIILKGQNEQLEKHNGFKSKIFSIISHDLRAPFNSIKGILNLVENHALSLEEVQNMMGLLGKELDMSMNMMNNLLVWSKAQLAETSVNLQAIDLQDLAEQNIRMAVGAAKQKEVSIENAIPANTMIFTDKERLNFVLRNLLLNAIKFSFTNGQILIEVLVKGDDVMVLVKDNGKGISPKNISRIFAEERFTTLGTNQEKGSGLGIMLCKELVESLSGEIMVQSQEGKGSTFSVLLPDALIPGVIKESNELAA